MFNQATSMNMSACPNVQGHPQIRSDFSGWKLKHLKHVVADTLFWSYEVGKAVKSGHTYCHETSIRIKCNVSLILIYVHGHPFTKTFQLLQYSSSSHITLNGYLPFSGKTFGLSIQGWLLVKDSLQWFSNSFYSMVESFYLFPWLPIQVRKICVSEYLAHFFPTLQEFRV